MREVVEALLQVLDAGESAALATVVRASGSTPQRPGARLLLRSDGRRVGTVGGGAIEQAVIEALERALQSGRTELVAHDLGHDLAMCCGGRMEIFVEPVHATPRLILFGAGHVAAPTAAMARAVGFAVCVVDEREELNSAARFPGCELVQLDACEWLERNACDARDWLLICTHSHHLDEQLLERCLRQNTRYVGMVGSRRKVYRLIQRVALKNGGNLAGLDRVYAPVGLDLGAVSPAEIAVSIVSELIALQRGKPAAHLRAVDDARLQEILSELDATDTKATGE